MDTLTGFQRDLLYILSGRDVSPGSVLQDELEAYYDQVISTGRLYPSLEKLTARELIEKQSLDGRTNGYVLSHHGKQTLAAHVAWKAHWRDSNTASR